MSEILSREEYNRYFEVFKAYNFQHQETKLRDHDEALRKELDNLKNGGWTPIDEQLPDKRGWYLCGGEHFKPTLVLWWDMPGFIACSYPERITHWMPLPEPSVMKEPV